MNQKSVRYTVSMSYFTNIAVQNVNKGFVYITDLTWSLINNISHNINNITTTNNINK